MMKPVAGGSTGTEGGLEAAVETLHETIGLGVIGGGRMMGDVEGLAEVGPEAGSELRAAIGGEVGRDAKASDPVVNEGVGAVGGGGGGERNGFTPAGGAIHDGEEVGMACRGWQGAY